MHFYTGGASIIPANTFYMEAALTTPKSPHGILKPDAALQPLTIFTGKWKVTGKNFMAAPGTPGTPVKGTVDYEWMPGEFFLVCHWDRQAGNTKHKGIGIIGCHPEQPELYTTNYDNLGYTRVYKITHENNTWKISGEYERATIIFAEDKKSFTENWEISEDAWNWKPLCELKAVTAL